MVHQLDMPLMNQIGIKVAPGADVQIAVNPTIIDIEETAKKRFQPLERECYTQEEFKFTHLPEEDFKYQMSNCLFEALVERTIEDCSCQPLVISSLKLNLSIPSCFGTKISCEKNIFSKFLRYKFLN